MSLDEYNKHATLGPMAGPATSAAASAGQSAYEAANARPTYHAAPSGGAAPSAPRRPRWMRRHPLARGVALLVISQIAFGIIAAVTRPGSPVADLLSLSLVITSLLGIAGILVGIRDRMTRSKAVTPADSEGQAT
ncbi:hypothetical protein [Sneathiella sp.]|uniref:hypothetical protein n=1 Tax=Sneathiella sp. TaxID=1964365 RepID=UPI002FE0F263